MQYTDTITKNFLTGAGAWNPLTPQSAIDNLSRWESNEDPTYMGFYFKFNPFTRSDVNNQDLDYLPQGLFLGANNTAGAAEDPDSAVNYLQRRGEYYRANMMKEFRDGMIYVADNTPWVFEKVTGMGDIWKIDIKNNFRAKEKKIEFECNESIDGKLTYLIDLYRKAAFDAEYMRYALPETQRFFSMDLIVTEIRWMGDVETATFLKFTFDYCEFDFFSEGLSYLESLSTYAGEGAKVKIPIKIGRIREVNTYGLLGGVLGDTWDVQHRDKIGAVKNFTAGTSIKDGTGELVNRAFSDINGYRNSDYTAGLRKKAEDQQTFNSDNAVAPDLGFLGNLATGALAGLNNLVSGFVNRGLLGNVYGFSLSGLGNALSGILNNPIAAAQGLLSKSTLNQTSGPVATRVNLTGPDIEFLKASLGTIKSVSEHVPSESLDKITIKDVEDYIKATKASSNLQKNGGAIIGNANLSFPPVTPENLGKETLVSAPFAQSLLGSLLLTGSGSIDGNPGQTTLSEANVDRTVSPDKQTLDGIGTSEGNPGKTQLDGIGSLNGNPGTEELIQPQSFLGGDPGKEQLKGNGANLRGPLKGVSLDDNGASLDGSLSTEDLISNGTSLKSEGGKVKLDGPEVINKIPGSVEFKETPKTALNTTKVKLSAPANKLDGKLGKEPLDGPAKKNNPLGNANLE
jgi:hypothetical protein